MSWTAVGYTVSAALIVAGFAAFTVAYGATRGARDGQDSERPQTARADSGGTGRRSGRVEAAAARTAGGRGISGGTDGRGNDQP